MLRLDINAQYEMGAEIRPTIWKVTAITARDAVRAELDQAFMFIGGGIEIFRNFEVYRRIRPKRRKTDAKLSNYSHPARV